jgi:hypothetical protein
VKRSRSIALTLVAVLSVSSFAPLGFADAYDAAMARAVAAKEKAVDSNDPSAWDEALRLFLEADAIKSTKDSKYELGGAAARLKEDDLAYESYEAAIALGLSGKAKEKAQAFLKSTKGIGHVDVKGPAGADITVGARHRGVLPHAPFVVFAGSVKIKATSNGQTVERSVQVKESGTEPVDLTADFAPKTTTTTSATTTTTATTTAPPPDVPKGASSTVPLADTGAGARTLGWSMIVGGGVLLAAGGVGYLVASGGVKSGLNELDQKCQDRYSHDPDQCQTPKVASDAGKLETTNANIRTWKGVRTASLVTGGVGLVVLGIGIVRLATAPSPPKASAWTPRLDVGFGYIGLSGVF